MDSFDYFLSKANSSGGEGGEPIPLSATANGRYTRAEGYSPVEVNVPAPEPVTESLTVVENGTYTPESGVDGFDEVTVAVPIPPAPTGTLSITENGTVDVSAYEAAEVNVPQGYPDNYAKINKYTKSLYDAFFRVDFPETFTVDFSDASIESFQNAFYGQRDTAYASRTLSLIGDMSNVTTYQSMIGERRPLEKIIGELDFSQCATAQSVNFMSRISNLQTISFKPNTLSISCLALQFTSSLDNPSLVSVANGLNATAVGQTLQLSSSSKSKCSEIIGEVGEDGLFVETGITTQTSMSLADFIGNVKGWNLSA